MSHRLNPEEYKCSILQEIKTMQLLYSSTKYLDNIVLIATAKEHIHASSVQQKRSGAVIRKLINAANSRLKDNQGFHLALYKCF